MVIAAALHCPCVGGGATTATTTASAHDCCPSPHSSAHPRPTNSHGDSHSCSHCGATVGALTRSVDELAADGTWAHKLAVVVSYQVAPAHSAQVVFRDVHLDGSPPGVPPRTLFDLHSCLNI